MNKPNLPKAIGAGIVGTIAMTMMTMVAPMMGMPEMNIPKMLSDFMGMPAILGWAAHFMIGTTFGLVYVYIFLSKLPGHQIFKGTIFGLFPWLLAQIMVNPMMGAGIFALNTPAPLMMVMGSLIGHLVYGTVLGAVYGFRTSRVGVASALHN
jgi:uncharacterized membrane protein YagU involved in acid resistance